MRAKFDVGIYTMSVTGDAPRNAGDGRSVAVQIDAMRFTGANPSETTTEMVCAFTLKPSHARAIASALLSAATEASSEQ